MSCGKSNEELEQIVSELRERISDVIVNYKKFDCDYYLIQWLKRFNFKLDKTETCIRECIVWRKENDIESLAHANKEILFPGLCADFPVHIDSHTKNGLPVFAFNGNGVDFLALFKKYGRENFLRYIYLMAMKAEQGVLDQIKQIRRECKDATLKQFADQSLVAKDGTPLGVGAVMIASFKDVSMWVAKSPAVLSLIMEAAKVATNYFPIFVNNVLFINANKIIATIFKLMKPFIASPYYPVECYDTVKAKWSAVISEHVEPSQLTPEFGGSRIIQNCS